MAKLGLVVALWVTAALVVVQLWAFGSASNYLTTFLLAGLAVALGQNERVAKLLVLVLAVSLAVEAWEAWSGSYLYVTEQRGIDLNVDLYSGAQGILRAKGLFQGPLTAAAFSLAVAALHRGEWRVWTLALIHAGLAQGRLAVVLLVAGALFFSLRRGGQVRRLSRRGRRLAAVAALAGGAWLAWGASPAVRDNYLAAFDPSDPRNQGRLRFWSQGLHYIWDRNAEFFIGHPGGTYLAFGDSTESDYLQILAAAGVVSFALLLAVAIWVTKVGPDRNRWVLLLAVAALPAATFNALPSGIAAWLVVLDQLRSARAYPEPHAWGSEGERRQPGDLPAGALSA